MVSSQVFERFEKGFVDKLVMCLWWAAILMIVIPSALNFFTNVSTYIADSPVLLGLLVPFLYFKPRHKDQED